MRDRHTCALLEMVQKTDLSPGSIVKVVADLGIKIWSMSQILRGLFVEALLSRENTVCYSILLLGNPLDAGGEGDSVLSEIVRAGDLDGLVWALAAATELGVQFDVNNREWGFGFSPLHYACESNRADIVSVLMEYGADPFQVDDDGVSPVDIATKMSYTECLKTMHEFNSGKPGCPRRC